MTLADLIAAEIRAQGPMRLDRYMELCLTHPRFGYYKTRDPLGRAGDFTTAPEISQIFGEMIGLCLTQAWFDQGEPARCVLAEPGPGRGTLMADLLRAARVRPGFCEGAELCLIETNPKLRDAQAGKLDASRPRWLDGIELLPEGPLFLIANEFFDALPIRQFQKTGARWRERCVGQDGGGFSPGLGPSMFAQPAGDHPDGTIIETCQPAEQIAGTIGARLSKHGGCAIIIDYGDWTGTGDTLQAVADHQTRDPFTSPGEVDLTAHVSFSALAKSAEAKGAKAWPLLTQGEWLARMGAHQRGMALAASHPDRADEISTQLTRLTGEDQMGRLFKVLALTGADSPAPPGWQETTPNGA